MGSETERAAYVRLLIAILEVCHLAVAQGGDERKWLLSTLLVLVDKSKSNPHCRYLLDISKDGGSQ